MKFKMEEMGRESGERATERKNPASQEVEEEPWTPRLTKEAGEKFILSFV